MERQDLIVLYEYYLRGQSLSKAALTELENHGYSVTIPEGD